MRVRGGRSEEVGDALLARAHQIFLWWYRVREGTLKRSTFRSYMSPLRREVERLLEAGSRCGVPKTAGTCRDILHKAPCGRTLQPSPLDQGPARGALEVYVPRLMTSPSS
jgi:hypothetical protein